MREHLGAIRIDDLDVVRVPPALTETLVGLAGVRDLTRPSGKLQKSHTERQFGQLCLIAIETIDGARLLS